jgi:hypothetical protein
MKTFLFPFLKASLMVLSAGAGVLLVGRYLGARKVIKVKGPEDLQHVLPESFQL